MMRKIGGDITGNCSIPEVLVAAHANMRVLALSLVTNEYNQNESGNILSDEEKDIFLT